MFRTLKSPFLNQDGGGAAASTPADATSNSGSAPAAPPAGGTQSWGMPTTGNQAANAANPLLAPEPAAAQAPQREVLDFAGRKIEVADASLIPALKELHGDYTKLTSTYTQTNQRLRELENERQTYLNVIERLNQQPQVVPAEPEPTQEEVVADFMDQFYENPEAAVTSLVEKMFNQKVQPVIEPISKEREWSEQVQAIAQKYPDSFDQMVEPMKAVLAERPDLLQHGLETVYLVAKGQAAQNSQVAAPTPEQLMSDPNFVQQYVLSNEQIRNQMISSYMQDKQQSNQQIPVLMGGQPGGQPPAMPDKRPTTLREGSKAFFKHLGL